MQLPCTQVLEYESLKTLQPEIKSRMNLLSKYLPCSEIHFHQFSQNFSVARKSSDTESPRKSGGCLKSPAVRVVRQSFLKKVSSEKSLRENENQPRNLWTKSLPGSENSKLCGRPHWLVSLRKRKPVLLERGIYNEQ